MKKVLSILLVLALLLPLSALGDKSQPLIGLGTMYVYTENGKTLNVRSEPRVADNIIGHLKFGEAVNVEKFLDGVWCAITWGSYGTAYVQSRYLMWYMPTKKPTPKPTPKPTATPKPTEDPERKELDTEIAIDPITVKVHPTRTSGWVNIRKGPATTSHQVERCGDGKLLSAIAETTSWYRVKDLETGVSGYVLKSLVQVVPDPGIEEIGDTQIGTLNVNGQFTLQGQIPDGYKLQVISSRSASIIFALISNDQQKPQMMLNIAFDEMFADVERMNDLSDEDVETLKESFTDLNNVEFSEAETGEGTKLLIAREVGSDTDFVSIVTLYKGYAVEFSLYPNPDAEDQTLTDAQVQLCIDFLTNLKFVPVD